MAHATSSSPIGPYVLPSGQDAQLIVPPWSHGAYIVQDPPTKEYLLFHLGNGAVDKASWSPCYDSASAALPGAAVPGGDSNAYVRSGGDGGAFIHTAPSLDGPWTPWRNSTSVDVSFPPGSWTSSIDNPAPYIFENGTTLLFFRSETCPEGWGNLAPACIGVARAPTWQGPYESLFLNPITHPEGEDPSVWRDARNNFHMLTNINTYHARCGPGVPCGGHAWSRDGLTWSNQSIAFGPVIRFTNGSTFTGAYIERPQVLQDADGTPTVFFTGFGRNAYLDSHNWAQAFCTAALNASTDCGPTIAPPPPPPVPIHVTQGGACLIANASTYPCAGGWGTSCPVSLGPCTDATSVWSRAPMAGGDETLHNLAPAYAASIINVDCNSCDSGTRIKVSNELHYANGLALDAATGTMRVTLCPGMCISGTTPEPRTPPCKAGEWALPTQVALVPCTDASAGGWAIVKL